MPLYDYKCEPCGPFEAWHKMSESSVPRACPDCNQLSPRIITAPNISLNSGSLLARVGSSEPRIIKRQSEPAKPVNQSAKPDGRPWMLGHAAERL